MRIYPFVLMLLASCATQPQVTPEQYTQALRNRCQSYGFRADEPTMANCVMQLDMAVRQQYAASKAQNDAQRRALAMQYLGAQQSQVNQLNRPAVTCTRIGDTLSCR